MLVWRYDCVVTCSIAWVGIHDRRGHDRREVKELHGSGQLTVLEDLRDGLASAPTALIDMLAGKNVGQLAVRLAPDPVGWRSE
jgi:NADPH-dependent curcumin reductase CurA